MNGKKEDIRYMNEMNMEEVRDNKDALFLLPVGISEGHGKHLPVGTDTIQAEYEAQRVAEELDMDTVIAPIMNYGTCRATSHLPGTISVSFDSFRAVMKDILDSMIKQGINNIVVLSGHAGKSHMTALELAAKDALSETDAKIMVLTGYYYAYDVKGKDIPESDGHGGRIETSRMMDIKSELVGEDRPNIRIEYPDHLVIEDYSEYLSQGMRGEASKASVEEGGNINDHVIKMIREAIKNNFPDK